jgi:hypothetical protein
MLIYRNEIQFDLHIQKIMYHYPDFIKAAFKPLFFAACYYK